MWAVNEKLHSYTVLLREAQFGPLVCGAPGVVGGDSDGQAFVIPSLQDTAGAYGTGA